MHRPRTPRVARALKLGALLYLVFLLSAITTLGLFAYGMFHDDRQLLIVGLAIFGATFLLFGMYRGFASSAHCPLCRGPVLSGSGAQRNRNAKRTFGSYRLRVARNIIFTNSFKCPYCNESTKCTPKYPNSR